MSSSIALWPACHRGTIIENCCPGTAHLAYQNSLPRALLMVSRDFRGEKIVIILKSIGTFKGHSGQ